MSVNVAVIPGLLEIQPLRYVPAVRVLDGMSLKKKSRRERKMLNTKLDQILECIQSNTEINIRDISGSTGIGQNTVWGSVYLLMKRGMVEKVKKATFRAVVPVSPKDCVMCKKGGDSAKMEHKHRLEVLTSPAV